MYTLPLRRSVFVPGDRDTEVSHSDWCPDQSVPSTWGRSRPEPRSCPYRDFSTPGRKITTRAYLPPRVSCVVPMPPGSDTRQWEVTRTPTTSPSYLPLYPLPLFTPFLLPSLCPSTPSPQCDCRSNTCLCLSTPRVVPYDYGDSGSRTREGTRRGEETLKQYTVDRT